MASDFVCVYTTHDELDGQMVESLLNDAGIEARLFGDRNATLLGAATFAFELRIEVPADDASKTLELIEAFVSTEDASADIDEEQREQFPDETPGTSTIEASAEQVPGDAPAGEYSSDPVWAPLLGLTVLHAVLFVLGGAGGGNSVRLAELGAQRGWPDLADGYRIITSNFLHFDLAHLLWNTEGLLLYGWASIRMFGLARASMVYMLAALVGGLASALVFDDGQVGAGSSGCVFALIALVLTAKARLAYEARVARWRGIVKLTGWALFALPPASYFDWAAHVSGLAVGAVMGLLLAFARHEIEGPFIRRGRVLAGIALTVFLVPWAWRLVAPLWDPCGTGNAEGCSAACSSGDAKACFARAVSALAANRTAEADPLLVRACDGGVSAACTKLGILRYERGFDSEEEGEELILLFERGCEGGSAQGCSWAGTLTPDDPALDAKALGYFKRGCEAGDASGCFALGAAIAQGRGQAKDAQEAARLYRRACDDGFAAACRELSVLLNAREDVEDRWKESWALLERACSLGDEASCADTGRSGHAAWGPRYSLPSRVPGGRWIDPLQYL